MTGQAHKPAAVPDYTPGELQLWTSNSFRRFGTRAPDGGPVCEPITQSSDGHPDLYFRNGGHEGPDARRMLASWNACAGIPTEMLQEVGTIVIPARVRMHELVAALRKVHAKADSAIGSRSRDLMDWADFMVEIRGIVEPLLEHRDGETG